ncbi:MAG: pitrilysin family protein [Candidatus Eisenbacteria bacterium]
MRRMRSVQMLAVFAVLMGSLAAPAAGPEAALTYTVEELGKGVAGPVTPLLKVTYSNGVTALIKESHSAPIVTVDVWVNTGRACETAEQGGVSHFFEHMFFKGTPSHPKGEMDKVIKGLGGINNAGTSVEYTHYYVTIPSDNYLVALDVLSDAIMNPALEPEEIEKERDVVKAEIRRKEDTPASLVFVVFQKQFAAGTPYQEPVLGTFSSLDGISRQTFVDYITERYRAGNLTVVVTGDVNSSDIVEAIGKHFENARPGKASFPEFEVKELTEDKIGVEYRDINQGYLMLGYPTDGMANLKEYATLEVAAAILGEGRSSRIYQSLVEKGKLASTATAWSWQLVRKGVLGFEVTFAPGKEDSVRAALTAEIAKVTAAAPSQSELEKAKALLRTSIAYATETTDGKATQIGEACVRGRLENFLEYSKHLDEVTPKMVQDVLKKYTSGKHYAAGMVLPKKDSDK